MSGEGVPGVDPFGLVGSTLAGKFRIDRYVAEGGFGVVYQSTHVALEKTVALKVLKVPTELSDGARREFLDKFAQEAKTIARFEHPAIVRVLDFGASPMPDGREAPWMVLEWVAGGSLAEVLGAYPRPPRSPAQILTLLRPVFEAVAYAHEEGIAHRDLKPANMMVVRGRRGEESLRLLDFGIAKVMREDDLGAAASGMTGTVSQGSGFSPQYAAPEQVMGTRSGPWSDVHALGLIVTELLLGRPAYNHADLTDLYADILGEPRPTPAKFGVDAGTWEPVLARALSTRPNLRQPNAQSLLDALTESLEGARGPAEAPPPPVVQSAAPLVPVAQGTLAGPATMPGDAPRSSAAPAAQPTASVVPAAPTQPPNQTLRMALVGALLGLCVLGALGYALGHRETPAPAPSPPPAAQAPAPIPAAQAPAPIPAAPVAAPTPAAPTPPAAPEASAPAPTPPAAPALAADDTPPVEATPRRRRSRPRRAPTDDPPSTRIRPE